MFSQPIARFCLALIVFSVATSAQVRPPVGQPNPMELTLIKQTSFDSCPLTTTQNSNNDGNMDNDLCDVDDDISYWDPLPAGTSHIYSGLVEGSDCWTGAGRCYRHAMAEGENRDSGGVVFRLDATSGAPHTTLGFSVRFKIQSGLRFETSTPATESNPNQRTGSLLTTTCSNLPGLTSRVGFGDSAGPASAGHRCRIVRSSATTVTFGTRPFLISRKTGGSVMSATGRWSKAGRVGSRRGSIGTATGTWN